MIRLCAGIVLGSLLITGGFAQTNQKLAQTSFQFLSVTSDARAAAMGEATTSLQMGSSSMFFNPAGMAEMTGTVDVSASINQYIADIKYNTFSVAVKPADGDYGVIGFSAQFVDYGDFFGTTVSQDPNNPKGYDDTGIFKLNAMALGVGYACRLTDQFSVGGQIRWARQDLGNSIVPNKNPQHPIYDSAGTNIIGYEDPTVVMSNKLTPLVFDFGTQYKTGFKSLVFGMSVRNYSNEVRYVYEGFQLPLVFSLGISMDVLDVLGRAGFDQSLNLSVDASHYRDHPEQVKIGLEYRLLGALTILGGYTSGSDDRNGFSYGVGLSQYGFAFNYSYTPFGVFNKVQRITARFSL
ncbi:MAG TPA: PorV/PorQ family protein [Bacteroidota bacterium]|nr:PorV/PorQ family protein [Bacteroidota bacterium]